jgi:hypothetical protein
MDCFSWRFDEQVIGSSLTIKDIERADVGTRFDCLLLHRNAYDVPCTIHPLYVMMNPTEFLGHESRVTFTKTGDMKGILEERGYERDEEVSVLHVEYSPHHWYPLDEDGYLPAEDIQGTWSLLGRKVHWSEFPKSTRVGFRGPMILWKDAMNLPDIYNYNSYLGFWKRAWGYLQMRFRNWIYNR